MSSREQVLTKVRAAVGAVPVGPAGRTKEVPRGYRSTLPEADLVELFVERVEDYRAVVTRCATDGLPQAVLAAVEGCRQVVVPEGLPVSVPRSVPDRAQTATELDRIDAVVTTASVGVAVTGTIVLEHGRPGRGRRALSLVPDRHVCIVEVGQVVADVPQAIARLDPTHPQTWISGPSATSDIELNRVEGVHGPRTLHVILVG